MSNYAVEMTDAALAAISAQARYIAVESQAPLNAERWLGRIRDAVDSLEQLPRRAAKAEEDAYVEYEVRQVAIIRTVAFSRGARQAWPRKRGPWHTARVSDVGLQLVGDTQCTLQ